MKLPFLCLLLSLAVATVFVIWARDGMDRSPSATSGAVPPEQKRGTSEAAQTSEPSTGNEEERATRNSEFGELHPELATRTSWTNPYMVTVWDAPNWRFDDDAMTALSTENAESQTLCTAEFLRDWNSFTAAFQVELPVVVGTDTEDAQRLVLEVAGPDSVEALRVTLGSGRAVLESVHKGESILTRETELAETDESASVRLSLTPNRLLVRIGSRLVINDPRPSALIGHRCRFRVSAPPESVISELRFDGE
jgi:hypothetical protein